MSHANISVFIPHMGCPHQCSFCNQKTISSTSRPPLPEEVDALLKEAYARISDEQRRCNTEIAFFGGSFTAIDRGYMTALLETAAGYIKCADRSGFRGIRISTRPDCIDEEILMLLKKYGVTAIELGAQSMNDKVLRMNMRGHTAEDVRRASRLIREHGFELGLQMMTGLYGSTADDEIMTGHEILKIRPDTVRIYPVSVLRGTRLCELYEAGEYTLYSFEECVKICGYLYRLFESSGIKVIRMGLHAEDGVEQNAVAGFYHPAFAEVVRSELVRSALEKYCIAAETAEVSVQANKSLIGAVYGHKKSNRLYFDKAGLSVRISENNTLAPDEISINEEVINVFKIT